MSKLRTFEGSFPLSWPSGWKRTPPVDRRRNPSMKAGWAFARRDLESELGLLGAVSAMISSDMPLGRNGLPIQAPGPIQDPGVAVYFALAPQGPQRETPQLVLACDRWDKVDHNLRAIGLHVGAMRGMDRWGVGSLDQAFKGYLALPEKATPARRPWTVVLALDPDATRDAVLGRFRELARIRHPDGGGLPGELDELIRARDAALEELGRRGGVSQLPFEMPEIPAATRFLNLCPELERKLLMHELPQLGAFQDTFAMQGFALLVDERIPPHLILLLDDAQSICGSINLDPKSWTTPEKAKPKRPAIVYRVRGAPSPSRCRYCRALIHWAQTPSGATMPLSWKTREAWIEHGVQIGFVFQPHFGDCPTWPKRQKKGRS